MLRLHSITSSARASNECGTERPSAVAVFQLMASSKLFEACTGRSAGFSPVICDQRSPPRVEIGPRDITAADWIDNVHEHDWNTMGRLALTPPSATQPHLQARQ